MSRTIAFFQAFTPLLRKEYIKYQTDDPPFLTGIEPDPPGPGPEPEPEKDTEDNTMLYVGVAIVVLAIIAIAAVLFIRRN